MMYRKRLSGDLRVCWRSLLFFLDQLRQVSPPIVFQWRPQGGDWCVSFWQAFITSPILISEFRRVGVGLYEIFQSVRFRNSVSFSKSFLVYSQLKNRWLIVSLSCLHRRHVDWIRTPHALNRRVLICLFFILHRKIENSVGMWDYIPFAKVSLGALVLNFSMIVSRIPDFAFHFLFSRWLSYLPCNLGIRHWLMRFLKSFITFHCAEWWAWMPDYDVLQGISFYMC